MALSFSQKIRMVLFEPGRFFNEIRKEKTISPALKTYAVALAIGTILTAVIQLLIQSPFPFLAPLPFEYTPTMILLNAVLMYVISILFLFIMSGFTHLFAPILGGKKGFYRTFNAFAYTSIPSSLLMWIGYTHFIAFVVIAILVVVWSIILIFKGISRLHEVSLGRALLILLIPGIILAIIAMIIMFVFILSLFFGALQSGLPSSLPPGFSSWQY